MKRLLAILLVLSMCFQFALKLGIVAWYNANKTYVATVLCENKNKPKMKCCGKCYLNKQLKKVDQQGTNNHQSKTQETDNIDCVVTGYIHLNLYCMPDSKNLNGFYIEPTGSQYNKYVFHPPSVAV